jgi:hypothetical protein
MFVSGQFLERRLYLFQHNHSEALRAHKCSVIDGDHTPGEPVRNSDLVRTIERVEWHIARINIDAHRESVGTHYIHHVRHDSTANHDVTVAGRVPQDWHTDHPGTDGGGLGAEDMACVLGVTARRIIEAHLQSCAVSALPHMRINCGVLFGRQVNADGSPQEAAVVELGDGRVR